MSADFERGGMWRDRRQDHKLAQCAQWIPRWLLSLHETPDCSAQTLALRRSHSSSTPVVPINTGTPVSSFKVHLYHHSTYTWTPVSPLDTRQNISQTFWYRLPIFQVDLNYVLHRVSTSSCYGHVDELATEPFLLLHREHGTGYRRSWNCCDRRTRFVVIWKHFCLILSTGIRIRIDSMMHPRSSSRGRNTSASVTVTVNTQMHVGQWVNSWTAFSTHNRSFHRHVGNQLHWQPNSQQPPKNTYKTSYKSTRL